MTSGAGRTIEWASYGQPVRITRGDNEVQFAYGPDRARYVRVDTQNKGQSDEHTQTTVMLGAYERVTATDGTNEARYYVGGIAIVTRDLTTSTDTTRYTLKDNQGSVLGYAEDTAGYPGSLQTAFDPWGWRRDVNGQVLPIADLVKDEYKTVSARGYTGQEQVDLVGLIHMNGRVYDPIIGRFISADPVIQDATDSQAYNRYAYVRNNPLSLTDPSGFSWLGDRWHAFKEGGWRSVAGVIYPQLYIGDKALREFGRFARKNQFVAEVAQIAGGYFTGGAGCPFVAAAVTYGVTDGDVGATAKSGAIAFVQVYTAGAIGAKFNTNDLFSSTGVKAVLAHGLLGGAVSLAQGGKFGAGFASGAFGKAVTLGLSSQPLYANDGHGNFLNHDWDVVATRTAIAAVVGGTASQLSGGAFANGAVTGAMQHLFNAEKGSFEKTRQLSSGEREVALRVHPDLLNSEIDSISIDFSLDMTCGGTSGIGCGGFTPYTQVNLPTSLISCLDVTTCQGGIHLDLFIHELTHAWTNINTSNFLGLSGSIRGFIANGAAASPVGQYLPYSSYLKTSSPVGLNSEQMADWFMWFDKGRRASWRLGK